MELSELNQEELTKKFWDMFILTMSKEKVYTTYFLQQEENLSLEEAISQCDRLDAKLTRLYLPKRVDIPPQYFEVYHEKYLENLTKLETGELDTSSKKEMLLLNSICRAYMMALQLKDKYSIEDELNDNIETLQLGIKLERPEYQEGTISRANKELYIQTLREILQMIEDAEKQ